MWEVAALSGAERIRYFSLMTLSSRRSLHLFSLLAFLLILCLPAAVFANASATIVRMVEGNTPETTPPSAPQSLIVVEGAIKGDSNSKMYYLPDCPEYGWLSPKNIAIFTSEEEARQAGYRKAKNCP